MYKVEEGSGYFHVVDTTNGMSVAKKKTRREALNFIEDLESGAIHLWDMPLI